MQYMDAQDKTKILCGNAIQIIAMKDGRYYMADCIHSKETLIYLNSLFWAQVSETNQKFGVHWESILSQC